VLKRAEQIGRSGDTNSVNSRKKKRAKTTAEGETAGKMRLSIPARPLAKRKRRKTKAKKVKIQGEKGEEMRVLILN